MNATLLKDLPAQLQDGECFVAWRYEERDGKKTKVPVNPRTGGNASVTDPSTWSSLKVAIGAAGGFGCCGVGRVVVTEDGYCGVDLDKCRNPQTGELTPMATTIVKTLDSYTEITPSCCGVRVWICATLPGPRCRKDGVEIYSGGRYFTLTGNHFPNTPKTVEPRQEELEQVYNMLFPGEAKTAGSNGHNQEKGDPWARWRKVPDDELLRRALKNPKFKQLWDGDTSEYGGDDSRADAALCCHLAYWTCKDPDRIERLFNRSKLADREKWQKREDYRRRTISNAIDNTTGVWTPTMPQGNQGNPWSLAVGMDVFLGDEEEPAKFLFAPVIAKEAVTEIFSPRGLGKSLWALFVAVYLALAGYKVLLIDRDNPRRVVRERLRFFGATSNLTTLKVLSRDNAPPLTNTRAWAEFPYCEYDLVIVDSLDSAAEGVGEQDSTKPSLAIASLLDIARRENGPAVLLLGNTIKSAKHSRGSGVIEDRADIVFEVRDATNFHPTGKKPWIEELPAADAGSWTGRSTRRKRLSKYRLAFVATKFRIGEEPEPFIIEIDLTTEPWTVRDVTDDVDREGVAARTRAAEERAAAVQTATESLRVEILRREVDGQPVMLRKQAEDFLVSHGNTRKVAREAINSPAFEPVPVTGKGHPKGVRVAGKKDNDGGIGTPTEAAPDKGSSNGDFGRPHLEQTAEIPVNETPYPCGSQGSPISAEPSLFTAPDGREAPSAEPLDDPDDEVAL